MNSTKIRYTEVGGWLLLLCGWLCVIQPLSTFGLLNDLYKAPTFTLLDLVSACLVVPLVCYGAVAGIKLWKIRDDAVRSAKLYFVLSIVFQILTIGLYIWIYGPKGVFHSIAPIELIRIGLSLPASVGWYLYLCKSVRVANTFGASLSNQVAAAGAESDTPNALRNAGSASIVERKDKYNAGIIVRIIGIFLLFVFPVGTAVGVGLIVVGWRMGKIQVCSECGNPVHDRGVKMCPACKVAFA